MKVQKMNQFYSNITKASKSDFAQLLAIWENSVKATHDFLDIKDFVFYQSRMMDYFRQVNLYVYKDEQGFPLGFMGVSEKNIEMLFVDAVCRGCGVGAKLLRYAISELHIYQLDVNEQNIQAVGFYMHMGFKVMGRSPFDNEGKPYPLLHLQYETNL